jgi:hypothetical protein
LEELPAETGPRTGCFQKNCRKASLASPCRARDIRQRLWFWRVPCRYEFISVHGPATLAAWTGNPKIVAKLASISGVRVHQRGDSEIRVLFRPQILDSVAELLQARRRSRPTLTDEQRRAKSERMKSLMKRRLSDAMSPV